MRVDYRLERVFSVVMLLNSLNYNNSSIGVISVDVNVYYFVLWDVL